MGIFHFSYAYLLKMNDLNQNYLVNMCFVQFLSCYIFIRNINFFKFVPLNRTTANTILTFQN